MNLKMNIPFSPPDVGEREIELVAEALRSGWITTGSKTKELERQVSALCGTSKTACLNSATAAMECALRLLGVGPGDEVITSAYTYTASASVVCHVGATLKLIDIQKDHFEMDYQRLSETITEKTKVVIPVDYGGVPCDYDTIRKAIAASDNPNVVILADAAHAFGSTRGGKPLGQLADFTSFSFHAVKNFTTAEGGALTWLPRPDMSDDEIYRQLMLMSLHGQSKDALAKSHTGCWEYDVVAPLYKCNMTDIHAAIGLAQMERYSAILQRRREIFDAYDYALAPYVRDGRVKTLCHSCAEYESNRHLYVMRLMGWTLDERDEFIERMAARGVTCNVHFKPLPMLTAYKNLGFDIKDYLYAWDYFHNEVTLPSFSIMTDDQAGYVIDVLKKELM